ncbi:MAG: hypothetical protein NT074_03675 [Methanomicrobiales archaeon]|nr:hypothetical protein [Methanomicrobiales archaeon]
MTTPTTRDEAITLLESAEWNPDRLTHEELAAVRDVFAIDDPRPIAEKVDPDTISLDDPRKRGYRWLNPREEAVRASTL